MRYIEYHIHSPMMRWRTWPILIALVFISSSICGQIEISGTLLDSSDKSPVSFATVSISGTTTGATSDQTGHFDLTVPAEHSSGILTLSCLGYETRQISMADVRPSGNVFILRRRAFRFREVTVYPGYKLEITAKMIESMMAKISDTLYICKYETPRYLYRAFLEDICKLNDPACEEAGYHPDLTNYHGINGYQAQVTSLNGKGFLENIPVSDITYEGAKQFSLWLTKKYSQFKNRKFKNAVFRLPTSAEWTFAAQGGGKTKTRFPWTGDSAYYYRPNDTIRTYFVLYNDSTDKAHSGAGSLFRVLSGYKNRFGLFNICGNVAEMVQERGVYKGGCAMDKIENIGIYAPQAPARKEPDYFIGFRVAMVSVQSP